MKRKEYEKKLLPGNSSAGGGLLILIGFLPGGLYPYFAS
jgi:hypothetical protein